jgi:hypothetical protein
MEEEDRKEATNRTKLKVSATERALQLENSTLRSLFSAH